MAEAIGNAGVASRGRAQALAERAEDLSRPNLIRQTEVLTSLVLAAGTLGSSGWDRAEALARTISDSDRRAETASHLTSLIADSGAGGWDRAEALARTISDSDHRAETLSHLTSLIADRGAGGWDRAETLARTISDPFWRGEALIHLAGVIVASAPDGRASALSHLDEAEFLTLRLSLEQKAVLMGRIAEITARVKPAEWDLAERIAKQAATAAQKPIDPAIQGEVLTRLVRVATTNGLVGWDLATNLALAITDLYWWLEAITHLSEVLVAAGSAGWDRADSLLAAIHRDQRTSWIRIVSEALVNSGPRGWNRAEKLVRSIADPFERDAQLVGLVRALSAAGTHGCSRAETIAGTIIDESQKGQALTILSVALLRAGPTGWDRGRRMANDVEQLVNRLAPFWKADLMGQLARAFVSIGPSGLDPAHHFFFEAEAHANTIVDPQQQGVALLQLARTTNQADQRERLIASVMGSPAWLGALDQLPGISPSALEVACSEALTLFGNVNFERSAEGGIV